MAMTNEIAGIVKWTEREEWADLVHDIVDDHVLPACEDFEIDAEGLETILERPLLDLVAEAAYYDFLTQRFEPDDRNTIDDYLKRRGWKESPGNRRYLAAVRDSVIGIYEIINVVPGESLLLRDLFRGGDQVRVSERTGSLTLKVGDKLGSPALRQPPTTSPGPYRVPYMRSPASPSPGTM